MKVLLGQLIRFGLVGVLASVTHYLVVLTLVRIGWLPLGANFVGFIIAFQVSFFGHFRWSFKDSHQEMGRAMRRFAFVAILGFFVNECLLWVLLEWSQFPLHLSLAMVLITVAGITFVLSRIWAFSGRELGVEGPIKV